MVRMDNLSAGIGSSSGVLREDVPAFRRFIQRHQAPVGGWRNRSETGGGFRRNRVAASVGIGWRNQSESGGGLRRNTQSTLGQHIRDVFRCLVLSIWAMSLFK